MESLVGNDREVRMGPNFIPKESLIILGEDGIQKSQKAQKRSTFYPHKLSEAVYEPTNLLLVNETGRMIELFDVSLRTLRYAR